ncbi:MAG: hypothetical protein A3F77_18430 [Betaproteobacteria bacterium RIFCSPLOWO2_12_FULL_67_28]|nr:MAG: hypothetical protein A3I65_00435 [Betaproteobacteria bacterium RIFCSPLOWO2_02_FULL_68_150]OGA68154.1 MAG: hypothetical protein A3F77_18430 [Betaproteobacteria bacterium RIFCSPLOWO2_12_FULL_67_28]
MNQPPRRLRLKHAALLFALAAPIALSGCDPVSLTMFGVGTAAGVQHTLTGIAYRTFSAPLARVRAGVNAALKHMDITVAGTERIDNGERIKARAADREIEIDLEAISPRTTRMRSTARSGVFMDAATATEIILQTEKALGGS